MKKIIGIIIGSLFVFGMIVASSSMAMMCGSEGEHSSQKRLVQSHTEHEHGAREASKEPVSEEAINVGNKICPVSGEKIEEKTKETYEYEGKIYNFCCLMCIADFKKDPGKYIKKIEELEKKESEHLGHEAHEGHPEVQEEGIHEGHHVQ